MKQQSEIQEKIATAKTNAKLETLKYEFETGDLSYESLKAVQEKTNEELNNLRGTFDQARIDTIAQAEIAYGKNSKKYKEVVEEANRAFDPKVSGLDAKAAQFTTDTIMAPYLKEFAKAGNLYPNTLASKDIAAMVNDIQAGKLELNDTIIDNIGQSLGYGMPDASRQHIEELFRKGLQPILATMQEDMKKIEKI